MDLETIKIELETIMITLFIMLFSIFITIKIAAKIFKIGILSYGTKPGMKELVRWIREK